MVRVERLLQIHIAVMAVIGSFVLGLARHDLSLSMLTLVAAITALIFTDMLGWFRLNRLVVNLAAIVVMGFCFLEFLRTDNFGKLSAVGDLLVYWQLVMLFQQKHPRVYWCLAMLSLLQIVVASVLHSGVVFGPLFVIFLIVGVFTLALFYIWRQSFQLNEAQTDARELVRAQAAASPWQQILGGAPRAMPEQTTQQTHGLVGLGFLRQMGSLSAATLVITIVFFYCMPRYGQSGQDGLPSGTENRVGFSRELMLGDIGRIQSSDNLVMRVAFTDPRQQRRYDVFGEFYLHGSVLYRYSSDEGMGRWIPKELHPIGPLRPLPPATAGVELVRQEIMLEPAREPILFGVLPSFATSGTPRDLHYNVNTHELVRRTSEQNSPQNTPYRYVLLTDGFRSGVQQPITLSRFRGTGKRQIREQNEEIQQALDLYPDQFPHLIAEAEKTVANGTVDRSNRVQVARALESHFRSYGLYTYSLDLHEIDRDRSLDPIEDFVRNHRTGHCELFASALVMMLRSQGIPARLVVGYKGGDLNSMGGYYQVRGRHAHAWVEAYLRPADLPPNIKPEGRPRQGAWMRLDPTPFATGAQANRNVVDTLADSLDYAQLLWSDYVVSMNQQQQMQDPLASSSSLLEWVTDTKWWSGRFNALAERLGLKRLFGENWVNWSAGLLTMALCLVAVGLYRLGGWLVRITGRWIAVGTLALQDQQHLHVEWYERLLGVLAQMGIEPKQTQTGQELAEEAAQRLAQIAELQAFEALPLAITEAYYAIRFGHLRLRDELVQDLEQELVHFEESVSTLLEAREGQPAEVTPRPALSAGMVGGRT